MASTLIFDIAIILLLTAGFHVLIPIPPVGCSFSENVDVNTVSLCIERESIVKKRIVSEEEILKLAKEAKDRFGSTLEKLGNS